MKKHLFKLLILLFVMLILISSGTALYFQITGSKFDPIKEIQKLQSQNRRDEALDLVQFYEENKTIDPQKLKEIKDDLEYTLGEKIKSFTKGAVKGEIKDTYSGVGAISSDLCVYGDIRDLGIQSWRYLRNEKTDVIVATLSGIGIILSAKPFADVIASYAKNTVKYIRNVSSISANNGILKKVLKGKLSLKESKLVLNLLKKTDVQYPAPQQFFQISAT
ncbi:MAG: hypothetical protein K8S18_21760 [Desulfobacula sp.]|nr:hypothetical protein [Desulfobacula sp.]